MHLAKSHFHKKVHLVNSSLFPSNNDNDINILDINLVLISSGSEIDLACRISHKLATDNIYSKVISMPCHEIFDLQSDNYKSEILSNNLIKVSIEASETGYWKKYTGNSGLNFGIDDFGKSAPYKDIYDYFKLDEESIVNKIRKKL